MRIGLVSFNNYQQNRLSAKPVKNVSFGEMDGDYYDYSPRMTKSQYSARKDAINEKYDNMRSSYLSDADDLEFDNSVVWQHLHRIEQMRDRELAGLNANY